MMIRENVDSPTILIDFKKNRIRIHRRTVQQIENPDYFLFLVNPDERIMAIQTCDASELRAQRNWVKGGTGQSFEIYSSSLLRQLRQCGEWEVGKVYKLTGQLSPQGKAILFRMKDAIEVLKQGSDRKWMVLS